MSRSFVLVLASLVVLGAAPLAAGPDRWTALGPEGGSIARLSASPSAPGTVWAVSSLGKVFKTTDGAATWSPVPSLQERGVLDVLPDPSTPSIIYARTFSDGVLKSSDGGGSWAPANEGLPRPLYSLAIAPSQPSTLYAAGFEQIFRSTDGGSHWEAVSQLQFPGGLAVSPADSATVLVISQDRVLRSRDGGAHWEELPGLSDRIPMQVVFDPQRPHILYAFTLMEEVFRSDDAGETWKPANEGLSDLFVGSIHIDPSSPDTLWIAEELSRSQHGIWRSDDRGEHWTQVDAGSRVHDIAIDATAGVLIGVSRIGVLRSADRGLHWTPAYRGLTAIAVTELAIASHGTVWAYGLGESSPFFVASNSLLRSRDRGATWEDLTPGPFFQATGIAVSPEDPATLHISVYGGVYNSRDGGDTWEHSWQGMRVGEILWNIALAPSQPDTLYTGGIGSPVCGDGETCGQFLLFKSTDGGTTWRHAGKGLPQNRSLASFAVHPSRPGTVWAGGAELYRSTNGGASWLLVGRGLPKGFIEDLEVDPAAPDRLYAAVSRETGRRVFKSADGGGTWRPAAGGLPLDANVWELALDPARSKTLYAATSEGVFYTDDRGIHWHRLGGPRPSPAYSVAVDPSDPQRVYVGTDAGLFVLTRTDR